MFRRNLNFACFKFETAAYLLSVNSFQNCRVSAALKYMDTEIAIPKLPESNLDAKIAHLYVNEGQEVESK
ncbi:hypothetical protein GCM10009332_19690 [Shewanella gelidii]|uniref:Uncharacterized protein n=1 Tax=Shewanella gelidii TaxID=1642821 RepID=A0A917NC24_9GAMM|nr:hypothetical protein GCM10009332_19690 [Shewanella gelidii]